MESIIVYGSKFISSLILMSVVIFVWHKLINEKINYKSIKLYITLSFLSIVSILNYYIVNDFLRIISITLFLIIGFKFLFNKNLNISILTPIYTQFLFMISETIFALVISIIFSMNAEQIISTQFGQFFSNLMISIMPLFIIKLYFVNKFYKVLIDITKKISKNHLIIFSIFLIIIANILMGILYYSIKFQYLLIFNTCLTLFCLFIVIYSFKTKNNYIKVYDKYNTTLNSLKEYEDMLDRYRVSNHENKNQLLTIRNMLPKTNKKTIAYIDKIVENKLKDNDKVMFEVTRIPAGGLRGLIYSKILYMKELKINYFLDISSEIKTKDLINIDDSLMLDICQVIGVYIDNAIQAVTFIKERNINIKMYLECNHLVISITNNYEGIIDIDKIEDKGYTSKGENRGYGLTLAKEIINNNKSLSNEKGISKGIFSQTLKIKM